MREPYYAVIFSSQRTLDDPSGYSETAQHMEELAKKEPGFLGIESLRDGAGKGITISYWKDPESIRQWRANEEHLIAQMKGKKSWYSNYRIRVCRVERDYEFTP